jgi:hypothetical protein
VTHSGCLLSSRAESLAALQRWSKGYADGPVKSLTIVPSTPSTHEGADALQVCAVAVCTNHLSKSLHMMSLHMIVLAVGNDHEGAVGGDCYSHWLIKNANSAIPLV